MSDTNLQNTNFDSIDSALEDFGEVFAHFHTKKITYVFQPKHQKTKRYDRIRKNANKAIFFLKLKPKVLVVVGGYKSRHENFPFVKFSHHLK